MHPPLAAALVEDEVLENKHDPEADERHLGRREERAHNLVEEAGNGTASAANRVALRHRVRSLASLLDDL